MLRLSILLLFALQICAVFCRSTPFYKDETTDVEIKGVTETTEDNKELNLQHGMLNGSVGLDTMSYDVIDIDGGYISYREDEENAVAISLTITFVCFAILSFILGCILYFCCRKRKMRPGFILAVQPGREVQEQSRPTAIQYHPPIQGGYQQVPPMTQPLQHHPAHAYQSNQKQSLLTAVEGGTGYSSLDNPENPTHVEFYNPVDPPPPYQS